MRLDMLVSRIIQVSVDRLLVLVVTISSVTGSSIARWRLRGI